MDEMQDLMDDSNDIQEVMSRSFMTPDDIDECDLESGKKIFLNTLSLLIFLYFLQIYL